MSKVKVLWCYFLIFCIMGSVYMNIEVMKRWFDGDLIGINNISRWTFAGWTSLWMFYVGGLCGFLLGFINEIKYIKKWPLLFQCLLGVVLVLSIEYLSGYLLNIKWGLSVWDYSRKFLNLNGQICFANAIGFFMICPFAFWLDDIIRGYLFTTNKRIQPLFRRYIATFTLDKYFSIRDIIADIKK